MFHSTHLAADALECGGARGQNCVTLAAGRVQNAARCRLCPSLQDTSILSITQLANAQAAYGVTCSLCSRIFGDKGPEFQQLIGATIRSVTSGILGVALIQSVLAGLGFLVAGLPGAGLWAVVFLVFALLQVGALVLIPAVIYVFATSSVTKAVIFMVWCLIVALIDNVLKPLLLGRGVAVPIAVVFLGAIGGFVAMGLIGLFVGAIVLSVGYKLFIAWLAQTPAVLEET